LCIQNHAQLSHVLLTWRMLGETTVCQKLWFELLFVTENLADIFETHSKSLTATNIMPKCET